jgi:hypothetical protein
VAYENPKSMPEKIDAIVFKKMYHILKDEIDKMRGLHIKRRHSRKKKGRRLESDKEQKSVSKEKRKSVSAEKKNISKTKKRQDDQFSHCEYKHPGTFVSD